MIMTDDTKKMYVDVIIFNDEEACVTAVHETDKDTFICGRIKNKSDLATIQTPPGVSTAPIIITRLGKFIRKAKKIYGDK